MTKNRWAILLTAMLLAAFGCSLPGTESPTPFVFPTPNLTLTAIHQPTSTPEAGASEVPETATPTSTVSPSPTVSQATATVEGALRPNASPLTAIRLDPAPTIDGDLGEWPAPRWSATEVVYGRDAWTSGSDLSASFVLGWDNANLYLAALVNDDRHVQTASGYSIWQGDSLEILLDTLLEADFHSEVLSADDYQLGLSPGNFGTRTAEAYRWFPRSSQGSLSSPSIAAVASDDGYVLEASIPWAVFGLEPNAGDRYGFAFSVSDNDLAGTRLQQSMVSSSSTRILTDPTSWGTLILGDSGE